MRAGDADQPETVAVARETIELAYLVAVQHLAPRPRAVLILRDVLGWPARDVAELLGDSGDDGPSGPDPQDADYNSFVFFSDPDGNTWSAQKIRKHVR